MVQLIDPVTCTDHILGLLDAPVTVVEYGDFECPKCKQAAGAVEVLFGRFGGQLRFVFRHFPLEDFHPHALHAAEVAECAGGQAKFWQMHDLLFANQSRLDLVRLYDYARVLELHMQRFIADMDGETYLQRVREHQRSGAWSGVRATPTFFVNGRLQDVSFGLLALFDAVSDELRRLTVTNYRSIGASGE